MATTANDSSAVNNEIADNAKPAETILSTGSLPDGTKYHVRQMRPDDIDEALQVWKEIGLYEGTHTIHSFRSIDPKGFFVAINEKDGSIIGECAGVFSEPSTAFIGLYAVRPNYQGMGVGYAVWKQMMNHIGDANAGLYAVEDHYNTYKYKAGFKVEDTVQVVEFKSTGLALENLETLNCSLENVQLVPINLTNDDLIKKITDYDESVVYFNRSKLLQAVLSEPDCLALAALEVPSERVIGYGTVYKNILNKAMAGPIFADNCEIAETLLRSLIEQYPLAISNGLYFMTPNAVPGGVEMARKLECSILGTCAGVFVDPTVAFIGLYAVRPAFQGKGIGINMWTQMMGHIDDRNAGLYAVPKHLKTYRDKAGFRVEDKIKILEFEGHKLNTEDLVKKIANIEIKELDEALRSKVITYDESIANYNRNKLLQLTFDEKDTLTLVAIDKDNGNVVGYGAFRTNNIKRAMAGPIYANNDAVAELIVYNLIIGCPVSSEGLDFMTPDCNPGGLRIANKLGLTMNEDLPRFFTKNVPKVDWDRIYCIHTPNFSPY